MLVSRATIVQVSIVAVLVGLMFAMLGTGGADRRGTPKPATTARPATEQERQQYDAERLSECLRDVDRCHRSGLGVESE